MRSTHKVRWRLEYADGKVVHGQWNRDNGGKESKASLQPTRGLVYACIECQDQSTQRTSVAVRVRKDLFQMFQFEMRSFASLRLKGPTEIVNTFVVGLSVCTHNEKITVNIDGSVKRADRKVQDQLFHYGR